MFWLYSNIFGCSFLNLNTVVYLRFYFGLFHYILYDIGSLTTMNTNIIEWEISKCTRDNVVRKIE